VGRGSAYHGTVLWPEAIDPSASTEYEIRMARLQPTSLRIAIVNSTIFGRFDPTHLHALAAMGEVTRLEIPPQAPTEEVIAQLEPYAAIVASVTPHYSREVLERLPNLRLIARHGIGYDNIDVEAAHRLGVFVSRVPSVIERNAVAEYTLALMLAASRHLCPASRLLAAEGWTARAQLRGLELNAATIGIVGVGSIGGRVGEILSHGFGATVIGSDLKTHPAGASGVGRLVPFATLLSLSDIITLHCDLHPGSRGLLDNRAFQQMKPGVILVNTARGGLVDMSALTLALDSGRVAAYAADVVEEGRHSKNHPLFTHPKVLLFPHIAACTERAMQGMGDAVVDAVRRVFEEGVAPLHLVAPRSSDVR
jgi:phosphoglycerate dehydrogenase-like enzyme